MPRVRKAALLPPEIRAWLDDTFVKKAYGDIEAVTAALNEKLQEHGVDMRFGKSTVGEESQRVRRAQEAIAATTRQMQLIANSARDDADMRGEALNAAISTDMFQAVLLAREAEGEVDPEKRIALMNKAALAAARLTLSSVRQRAWRQQVEERAKAAAEAVSKIARQGGLSAAQVREIRNQILGVAKAAPNPVTAEQPVAAASQT